MLKFGTIDKRFLNDLLQGPLDIQDQVKQVALLDQAKDKNSYICNNVNLDELWNFFFDTGFIDPDKYAFIQKNKRTIKNLIKKPQ